MGIRYAIILIYVHVVVVFFGFQSSCFAAVDGGYEISSDLWEKAVLQTPVGPVTMKWKAVGTDTTPSGDKVVSGYFFADPQDYAYGSPYNPEVFVKIYIASNGWANIAFNHVTVDDVSIATAQNYGGIQDQTGTATLNNRLVEHQYNGVSLQGVLGSNDIKKLFNEGGFISDFTGSSSIASSIAEDGGYDVASALWTKAVLHPPGGPVVLKWKEVGSDTTPGGDQVISGYFYASPDDFAFGSVYNPEVFVKIYIASNGWANIAFNHVTVDDVTVYSSHNYTGTAHKTNTVSLSNRLAEHQYTGVSIEDDDQIAEFDETITESGSTGSSGTYTIEYFKNAETAQDQIKNNDTPVVINERSNLLVMDIAQWPRNWKIGEVIAVRMPSGKIEYKRLLAKFKLSTGQLAIGVIDASLLEVASSMKLDIDGTLNEITPSSSFSFNGFSTMALVDAIDYKDSKTIWLLNKNNLDLYKYSNNLVDVSLSFPQINLSVSPTIQCKVTIDKPFGISDIVGKAAELTTAITDATADTMDFVDSVSDYDEHTGVISIEDIEDASSITQNIIAANEVVKKLESITSVLVDKRRLKTADIQVDAPIEGTIQFSAIASAEYKKSVEQEFGFVLVPIAGPVPIFLQFEMVGVAELDFDSTIQVATGADLTYPIGFGCNVIDGEFQPLTNNIGTPQIDFTTPTFDGSKAALALSAGIQIESGLTIAKLVSATIDPTVSIVFETTAEIQGDIETGCVDLDWDLWSKFSAELEVELLTWSRSWPAPWIIPLLDDKWPYGLYSYCWGNDEDLDDIDDDSDGYTENQGDCDDTNPYVSPGSTEICGDGIDQDCTGNDLACQADNSRFFGDYYFSITGNNPQNCSDGGPIFIKDLSELKDGKCQNIYIPRSSGTATYSFNDCDNDQVTITVNIIGNTIQIEERGECSGVSSPCWTWDVDILFNESLNGGSIVGSNYDEDQNICQGEITGSFSNTVSGGSLIAYYPFNGNTYDESGNKNNGIPSGVKMATDQFNNLNSAYYFDGKNDLISVPDDNSLDTKNNFSITVWFETDNVLKINPSTGTMAQTIIQYGKTNANGKNNHITIRDRVLEFIIRGHNNGYEDLIGTTIIQDQQWYHAALTYDGNTAILYLDGKKEVSKPATMFLDEDSGLFVGKYKNPSSSEDHFFFEGKIDDIRIYNRALSETEIQALSNLDT